MRYIICAYLLTCTISTHAIPDWIAMLKNGETQMKIEVNGKYYFRNIATNAEMSQKSLCKFALDSNIAHIKHNYPFSDQIPMEIQIVHYEPNLKLCGTTIMVDKKLADTLNNINRISRKNKDLEKQNKKLQNLIAQNKQFKILKSIYIEKLVKIRKSQYAKYYKFEYIIQPGFSKEDVEEILQKNVLLEDSNVCYNKYKTRVGSDHGDYIICWNRYKLPNKVIGVFGEKKIH